MATHGPGYMLMACRLYRLREPFLGLVELPLVAMQARCLPPIPMWLLLLLTVPLTTLAARLL